VRALTVFVPALFIAMLTTLGGAALVDLPGGATPYAAGAAAALLAGAFVVVTLIFFATRFLTDSLLFAASATVKGVPAVSKLFRRHHDEDEATPSEDEKLEAAPEHGRPVADLVTSYTAYRSTVAGPAEPAATEGEPSSAPAPARADTATQEAEPAAGQAEIASPGKYADLGQRIADVLRVAEESSEQLLAEARADAAGIRAQAESDAEELRRRTEQELTEERKQLARLRSEAEAYAEQRRQSADEEASTIRGEAEGDARALREEGEEIRRRLEQEGTARQQQLTTTASEIETRLRQALDTSRSVAAELERLLNGGPSDEDDATLAEAMELQQRRS
jgi:hypothetical protein